MSDIDLGEPIEGTTLALADLVLIGEAVLRVAALPEMASHCTPCNSTDYAAPEDVHTRFVRDVIRWSGLLGEKQYGPHRDRAQAFLAETGWRNLMLAESGHQLKANEAAA